MIASRGNSVAAETAEMFSRVLAHRGPDDHGFLALESGNVCIARDAKAAAAQSPLFLIHRRLSILDLSELGWQPMSTPDGRYWLIFNGEIYNFIELRQELETLGHTFRSTSDTEVFLAAYQQWGNATFARLTGMFALAVLDTKERKLTLARDFFGIKPLYYCRWRGGFAFASEVKPLLELEGVDRGADAEALYFYLRHGVTDYGDKTLFASVKQVPAAHICELDLDDLDHPRFTRYWELDASRTIDISYDEAARRLRDLFVDSVKVHLRSDVPVGAALSGGIDSTAIVTAMREIVGEKLDLHAFSYIADDPKLNEEKWIDLAAKTANATLHKIHVTREDLMRDLPRLLAANDQPVASTSIYAQFRVMERAASAGVKVMLDGQGADEMLAGYRSFLGARMSSLVRSGNLAGAYRFMNAASNLPGMSRSFVAKLAADQLLPSALQHRARAMAGKDFMPAWLDTEWFRERGVRGMPVPRHGSATLRGALRTAMRTVLPALLRYEDRNSMFFSIESRVPFLTPQIASFIFSLPESYIVDDTGETKSVFRAAMRGIVPDAILDRRDKLGFATPEAQWLGDGNGYLGAMLRNGGAPPIAMNALRREVEDVRSGARPFHNGIWRSVNLIRWAEAHGVSW